jgi:hypothetical protein
VAKSKEAFFNHSPAFSIQIIFNRNPISTEARTWLDQDTHGTSHYRYSTSLKLERQQQFYRLSSEEATNTINSILKCELSNCSYIQKKQATKTKIPQPIFLLHR